eukprot:s857_g14.t1
MGFICCAALNGEIWEAKKSSCSKMHISFLSKAKIHKDPKFFFLVPWVGHGQPWHQADQLQIDRAAEKMKSQRLIRMAWQVELC